MSVSKEDVEYIAKLSRLSFNEEEKESLINDLNNILNYMKQLNELNTDAVDIVVNPYYMENKFREDQVVESMELEKVLENAPEKLGEYVVVPKIMEE
ncbi:Asp-tRNA(Asn)/Glu-tRNA(Gln) amidotransferase subunit GatC [Haloimpatiens lingqiaonensis]|uniref:Asp-tRNA(Asn)/Glu-tRNA(Gln) amidotransferase subunit GatC n=1 Tax=Haloimpatiens lingqiaonensis TaxID=1380675 RepID=UPI0010FE7C42|nr:Asp-tRNA(Asn)/Glu-tRNA(Gln) amidotransferase subunit GatC [Haloimpatiens lingqiaonensis]